MILYTPLAHNDIFPEEQGDMLNVEHITYGGKMIYATRMNDGTYQVQQLVSTDPQDYLRSEFSPGSILS